MKTTKLFALALFAAAALCATTSCEDNDSWQSTWAIPLVSSTTLTVADFVLPEQVDTFNMNIQKAWRDYVIEEHNVPDVLPAEAQRIVDSVAFDIFKSGDGAGGYSYVDYSNPDLPVLNRATQDSLMARLVARGSTEEEATAEIEVINKFLEAQASETPDPVNNGDSAMNILLRGIIDNPTDVFTTAANMKDHLGGDYIDRINGYLDHLLGETNMNDFIDLKLSNMIGDPNRLQSLEVFINMNNTLPYTVRFNVSFVDADSANIYSLFVNDYMLDPVENIRPVNPDPVPSHHLHNIALKTAYVQVMMDLGKEDADPLTTDQLRVFAGQGSTFDLRVKIQAPMSGFSF